MTYGTASRPLLLAEGRQPVYVAKQLGHSLAVLLSTYAHLIAEYEDAERIDAEAETGRPAEKPVRPWFGRQPSEPVSRPLLG